MTSPKGISGTSELIDAFEWAIARYYQLPVSTPLAKRGEMINRIDAARTALNEHCSQLRKDFSTELLEHNEITSLRSQLATAHIEHQTRCDEVERLRSQLSSAERQFDEHTKHVATFLSELYGLMIDPLADGQMSIAEMTNALRDEAKRQRDLIDSQRQMLEAAGIHDVRPSSEVDLVNRALSSESPKMESPPKIEESRE